MSAPEPIWIPSRQLIDFITAVKKIDVVVQQTLDGRVLTEQQCQQLRDEHVRALIVQHPGLAKAADEAFVANPKQFQPWRTHTAMTFTNLRVAQIDPSRPREFKAARAYSAPSTSRTKGADFPSQLASWPQD